MFRFLLPRVLSAGAVASAARSLRRRPARAPASPRGEIATAVQQRPRWRSALAILRLVTLLAFLLVWALLLRPQALGGPAAWVLVSGNSMQPALHDGDLVLAERSASYRHGDVIAYRISHGDVGGGSMVIHRIAGGNGRKGFVTQGDNRGRPDVWRPTDADIAGRLVLDVPAVGDALRLLRKPLVLAALAALTAFLTVPERRRHGRAV